MRPQLLYLLLALTRVAGAWDALLADDGTIELEIAPDEGHGGMLATSKKCIGDETYSLVTDDEAIGYWNERVGMKGTFIFTSHDGVSSIEMFS